MAGVTTIATIGYQGATPEGLVAALAGAGVAHLIDVRAHAGSRRPGFSKGALAQALAAAGIAYDHLPGLGTPKAGRDAARAGRRVAFERIYAAHMESPAFAADLQRAAGLAAAAPVCLLCLERHPGRCHRALVADVLSGMLGLEVVHLEAGDGRDPRPRTAAGPGQGAAAAG